MSVESLLLPGFFLLFGGMYAYIVVGSKLNALRTLIRAYEIQIINLRAERDQLRGAAEAWNLPVPGLRQRDPSRPTGPRPALEATGPVPNQPANRFDRDVLP